MFTELKALVVVLTIAAIVFTLVGKACRTFVEPADFKRRRDLWFVMTILGFVMPSIWLFALVAMPLTFIAAKRDPNPLALYVALMFAVPNVGVTIPTIGIGQLFDLSWLRILSFTVLIPAVLRQRGQIATSRKANALDWLLIAYCLLQIVLFIPYESPTNTLRRAFLTYVDTFVVFYAFSRLALTRRALGEVAATAVVLGSLLGALAVFESVRGWLLFEAIPAGWGVAPPFSFLMRGSSLRAQVTTGQALILGYTMNFCMAFWFYIQARRPRASRDIAISLLMCAGLIVTYSRGAWLTLAILFVTYMALRPGATRLFVRALPALAIIFVIMYFSPLKEAVIDRLPLIGSSDQDTIDYRQQLFDVSWRLIKLNPWFGDPFVTQSMEELRQGQGIIDLINGYIVVTLFSGVVGLALFVSFFAAALWRCFTVMLVLRKLDPNATLLGAALVACMVASLFFIATAGVGSIEYLLAGLLASYAALAAPELARRNQGAKTNTGTVRLAP